MPQISRASLRARCLAAASLEAFASLPAPSTPPSRGACPGPPAGVPAWAPAAGGCAAATTGGCRDSEAASLRGSVMAGCLTAFASGAELGQASSPEASRRLRRAIRPSRSRPPGLPSVPPPGVATRSLLGRSHSLASFSSPGSRHRQTDDHAEPRHATVDWPPDGGSLASPRAKRKQRCLPTSPRRARATTTSLGGVPHQQVGARLPALGGSLTTGCRHASAIAAKCQGHAQVEMAERRRAAVDSRPPSSRALVGPRQSLSRRRSRLRWSPPSSPPGPGGHQVTPQSGQVRRTTTTTTAASNTLHSQRSAAPRRSRRLMKAFDPVDALRSAAMTRCPIGDRRASSGEAGQFASERAAAANAPPADRRAPGRADAWAGADSAFGRSSCRSRATPSQLSGALRTRTT